MKKKTEKNEKNNIFVVIRPRAVNYDANGDPINQRYDIDKFRSKNLRTVRKTLTELFIDPDRTLIVPVEETPELIGKLVRTLCVPGTTSF